MDRVTIDPWDRNVTLHFPRKARFHEPRTINETKRTKKNRRKENDLYVEQKKKQIDFNVRKMTFDSNRFRIFVPRAMNLFWLCVY